uniref:NTP_transf_2 domain-containing protein n=1 Tax=Meloidogyne hapla TaxID=6305 RepID=A0A1I8B9V1_MELHA
MDLPLFEELPYFYAQKEYAETALFKQLNSSIFFNENVGPFRDINYVFSAISKWAKYHCSIEFLLSGSQQLKNQNADSDVDAIVVLHKRKNDKCRIHELNQFYGNPNNDLCNYSFKEECKDGSLYCYLCRNYSIHKLRKNMHSRIRIIEFVKNEINFDISFVIIYDNVSEISTNTFQINKLNNQKLENIIENKVKQLENMNKNRGLTVDEKIKEKRSEMLSLASYHSNNIMIKIVEMTGNFNKFRFVTRAIKQWAKSEFARNGTRK